SWRISLMSSTRLRRRYRRFALTATRYASCLLGTLCARCTGRRGGCRRRNDRLDIHRVACLHARNRGSLPTGIRRDELGYVDGVLADDHVLGHDRAREATVLDRVQNARGRTLAADVEVRTVVRLGGPHVGR